MLCPRPEGNRRLKNKELLLEGKYVATQQRINDSLTASAEVRYLAFIRTYPALVQQIPQQDIASYIGITPQSLSRIRKELSHKP